MELGGSNQDGSGVVNMTRAREAVSPWLNHPRKTIIQVEGLVTAAAALLLLQLILGSCRRRRRHNSFFKYCLQVCNRIMFPLILYTLSTMQSSPIKNSFYPVWAAFLIMASAGTTAVQQYDFSNSSFDIKYLENLADVAKYGFYVLMFVQLMSPNPYTLKTAFDPKWRPTNKMSRLSSYCVIALVGVALNTKLIESMFLAALGYKREENLLHRVANKIIRCAQALVAKRTEEISGKNDVVCEHDSDPRSMKGYKYAVTYYPSRLITVDQVWDSCVNSADGEELKDLSLSCALFRRLVRQHYFGQAYPETSLLKDHDFVFKKLLPSEGDFKRAFRVIEAELGFCYDFFFTKYYYIFTLLTSSYPPYTLYVGLLRVILILIVGVFAIRKSLVLETPNPIIEVHTSGADYGITLLVLVIALIVELVQAAVYLASNWAQVSVACMHVKKYFFEPNAIVFGKAIGFLRRFMISGAMRHKIDQHSYIFPHKQQPDPVVVSDEVKRAIARSLILTYGGDNLNTIGETSLWQNQMFDEYSWALKNLSRLEVMLIWHIATEYCNAIPDGPSDGNGTTPSTCAHLFGKVLQLIRPDDPRRNSIARDGHCGTAVHLSRYCAYLIRSVPELLPYHKADIAEVAQQVKQERKELYASDYSVAWIYDKMIQEEEHDDPRKLFQKGVKLGKQLVRTQIVDRRWEVLKDFWAETIIHAAASHYTAKQHMQHLENGGEFVTHIWALLAHAGILNLNRGKDQEQGNLGSSGISAAA